MPSHRPKSTISQYTDSPIHIFCIAIEWSIKERRLDRVGDGESSWIQSSIV